MYALVSGVIAGVLAVLGLSPEEVCKGATRAMLLGFIAAGYTGTDFIEGMLKR